MGINRNKQNNPSIKQQGRENIGDDYGLDGAKCQSGRELVCPNFSISVRTQSQADNQFPNRSETHLNQCFHCTKIISHGIVLLSFVLQKKII
ncbi:MAG: hypothetical protein LBG58_05610 [Planctomycetaceae bacterium]|nr:hypothetical protein [Planctomycetaceae bacterium]